MTTIETPRRPAPALPASLPGWTGTALRAAAMGLLAAGLFTAAAAGTITFWIERLRDDALQAEARLETLRRDVAEAEVKLARLKQAGAAIIDCTDVTGKPRICVRVDQSAGEMKDAASGAVYRAIHGL